MAQTGYTPILIYSSSTAAAAPSAGNLTNSTLGSELAINITDGKLFYKDNANAVQVIGWKVVPTTAGGTGLTSYAQGDLLYYNSGTTLTALAKSTTATRYLSNTGTNNNPAWAQVDLTNGVTGTLPVGNGGTGTATAFTAGSVIFAGASGVYTQSNANLFWDNSNNRLGIGSATPATQLQITNSANTGATMRMSSSSTSMDNGTLGTIDWYSNDASTGGTGVKGNIKVVDDSTFGTNYAMTFATGYVTGGVNTVTNKLKIDPFGDITNLLGNFIIGTSGKGIDFSATAGTGTSELLADYEEGTWTPTITAITGSYTTVTSQSGTYTKVGRQVTVRGFFVVSNKGTGTGGAVVSNLPFTTAADRFAGSGYNTSTGITYTLYMSGSAATSFEVYKYDGTDPIVATQGNVVELTYFV